MTLDEVYAQIPEMKGCVGKCWQSCGPISFSDAEATRILRRMRGLPEPRESDGMCSMLNAFGRCDIYADRPVSCRLWGATVKMPCVFGCEPERMLSRDEGRELLRLAEEATR